MPEYKINLNLNNFLRDIKSKKQYIKTLKEKVNDISNIQKNNHKILNFSFFLPSNLKKNIYENDNIIMYIIDITFSQTNSLLHIMDFNGNLLYFCSAGSLGYKGKRKKARFLIFKSFYKILLKKFKFLINKPVALHLKNVSRNKVWIVKKLKKKFFITIVKIFNTHPHNGCRKKKVRRKKFRTKKK